MKAVKGESKQNQFHEYPHSGCLLISNNHNKVYRGRLIRLRLLSPTITLFFFSSLYKYEWSLQGLLNLYESWFALPK